MTIKTQGGKVITKDGKVSCSCCETGCCMYSAEAFDKGLYTADDLPDSFTMFGAFELPPIVECTKDGDGYIAGEFRIELYFSPPLFPGQIGRYIWAYEYYEGFFSGISVNADCLISGITEESQYTTDNFANTYTIAGPISGTVTRSVGFDANVCEWTGDGLRLRYNGGLIFPTQGGEGYTPSGPFKWQINGNNKSGFQNTPVGSYAGGFTVS